jgi:hypothetical protein
MDHHLGTPAVRIIAETVLAHLVFWPIIQAVSQFLFLLTWLAFS